MRRQTLALALFAICTSSTLAQSGVLSGPFFPSSGTYQTVPGGTFEPGDHDGWGDHLNVATLTPVTTPDMRGEQVGLVQGWSVGWYTVNKQFYDLTPGATYVLSGFFGAAESGGSVAIDIGNYGGLAWYPIASIAKEMTPENTDRWYFGYTTFVADNSSLRIRLVRNGPTVEYAHNYFDDIAITPVKDFAAPVPVPEPASLLALAVGGGALTLRRRARKCASSRG